MTEHTLRGHNADLHTLKAKVKALESRAEDAENHNRRKNLYILGLPEGVKGSNPTAFTEELLPKLPPNAIFFLLLGGASPLNTSQ